MQGNTLTAYVGGAIDHHTARQVREAIDSDIVDLRPKKVELDLSEVDFMDSAGLGLILGRYAKISERGGTLSVKNPSDAVVRIIKMAGAHKYVSIEYSKKTSDENKTPCGKECKA
mgnify:FL=1